jgi:site-specific recombinase XerC
MERLVQEGLTTRQIANALGISQTTVRYWLRRYGLATCPRRGTSAPRVERECPTHGVVTFVLRGGSYACASCRAEAVTRWRQRAKAILVAEAGGACVVCGYNRSLAALQFHHVDPAEKRFGLGARGLARSIDVLREEAAKCALVCANCHAEVEAGHSRLPSPAVPA